MEFCFYPEHQYACSNVARVARQTDIDHVYDNLKWGGTLTNPDTYKLYPPRYGKKDKP